MNRLAIALMLFVSASPTRAADDGWVNLIGTNLDGWVQKGGKATYRIDGGELVGTSVPKTSNSFLCTKKAYGDFVLEVEFKTDPALNSGVQVRSECFDEDKTLKINGKDKKIKAGVVHGYQIEIDPLARAWSGGIYDESRRGWLKDLKENEPARKAYKAKDWNKFVIDCTGETIKTTINGVPAAELKDGMTRRGFIALQVHGVGDKTDPLEVRFRNLRIKEK